MRSPPVVKIAHIDTGISLRGGQRQMLMLARGLRERGHEQVIVCLEGAACRSGRSARDSTFFHFLRTTPRMLSG